MDLRISSYLAKLSSSSPVPKSFCILTDRRNLVLAVNTADFPGNEIRMWYNPDEMENPPARRLHGRLRRARRRTGRIRIAHLTMSGTTPYARPLKPAGGIEAVWLIPAPTSYRPPTATAAAQG